MSFSFVCTKRIKQIIQEFVQGLVCLKIECLNDTRKKKIPFHQIFSLIEPSYVYIYNSSVCPLK